ncbi:hypothetical protein Bbelb_296230 [Branchiostoma belcheri]|nr:hypothetical protein Bbelb_296230 [Branchiostoma belcheri]
MPGIAALRVSNRANSVRYTSLTAFRSLSNLRKLSGVQALDARQEAVSRCSQQQQTNACNATLYNFEKSKMSGSRRTYRTLPLDVPHSPAERIALSRRTSRTLPREVPHSVLHSPAERPSKIDAYFVACAVPTKTLEFILSKWNGFEQVLIELIQSNPTANQQEE